MTCGQGQPFTKLTLDEHVSAGGVYLCELLPRRQPHLLAVDSPARRCVRGMWARKQDDDDGEVHIPERQRDTEKQVARRLSGRQKGGGGGGSTFKLESVGFLPLVVAKGRRSGVTSTETARPVE